MYFILSYTTCCGKLFTVEVSVIIVMYKTSKLINIEHDLKLDSEKTSIMLTSRERESYHICISSG